MKTINELLPLLQQPQKIAITFHYNADADALGSSLGLCHYFRKKGHQVNVLAPNEIPDFIQWMPGFKDVIIFEKNPQQVNEALLEADFLFCLDFNHLSRTKILEATLQSFPKTKVMIDHHLMPDTSFDYGISDAQKSSTCEMVYDFIQLNNDNSLIDIDIAKCLYAGLMTDTGSFKFPATTAGCHRMVADLMDKGLEPAPIHQAIFDTFQENRLRFLGFVLSERLTLIPELHAAIIAVSREDLNRFHINTGDTEGIVNYPLSIKNIIFSTFISQRENENRMSFRSKGKLNVNQFARTYFNGGGHANASGGRSTISLQDTVQQVKSALLENKTNITACYNELIAF